MSIDWTPDNDGVSGVVSDRAETPLLQTLVESGEAEHTAPGRYRVPHVIIASLPQDEAFSLVLPAQVHHVLRLESDGALGQRDTRLLVRWYDQNGAPAYLDERVGSFIRFEGQEWLRLASPLFELLNAVDEFNAVDSAALPPERLALWASVRSWLPDDDILESEHLRQITVYLASAFTVLPKKNAQGELGFDIQPGRWVHEGFEGLVGDEKSFQPVLPEAYEDEFQERFDALSARSAYAVRGGMYLIASPDVTEAFQALKKIRDSGDAAIRDFLRQPHATLKSGLTGSDERVDATIDSVFSDVGYGDRVTGIGLWEAKVLPWVTVASAPWLPPEQLGVLVGGRRLAVDKTDVPGLIKSVAAAVEEGKPTISYNGVELPATQSTLEALRGLESELGPASAPQGSSAEPPASEGQGNARTVLQIDANLEVVGYRPSRRIAPAVAEVGLGPRLESTLFSHQRTAVDWLEEHFLEGQPGALLADDMGLGKTLQSLAFLVWIHELMKRGDLPKRPILIVAPTGLLKNWISEHDVHLTAPGLGRRIDAFGAGLRHLRRERGAGPDMHTGSAGLDLDAIRDADWVLTSYETWRDYQLSFGRLKWSVAVFDEVQKAKNPAAAITDAAKAVNADFILALTGTPVENRLADLWCIVDLVQPGLLGPLKEFSRTWEAAGADLTGLKDVLKSGKPPVMLRRMKEDHVEGLSRKRNVYARRAMPLIQASEYDEAIGRAREGSAGSVLEALAAIRNISLHPHGRGDENLQQYVERSARLSLVVEWLSQIKDRGEKALVFAESRAMQSVLAEIGTQLLGLVQRPLLINGAVSGPLRQQRVEDFQRRGEGFDMMILSPKAGGVGLTLTGANHVIHLSRWWNPSVEDQCTDRVFRIGQKKEVFVYHPIAEHSKHGAVSFDVRLDQLLREKRMLSRTVLAPAGASSEDFENLLRDITSPDAPEDQSLNFGDIDALNGIQFEDWVASQLKAAGYQVSATPQSHDGGADLVAKAPGLPTLFVQCKHTQVGAPLSPSAVFEVLGALKRFEPEPDVIPMVATNSAAVSTSTAAAARKEAVHIWGRPTLAGLRQTRVFLGPLSRTDI